MEPPRECFERSIPKGEEKMKELLDNFKTEMLVKFQEQDKRIAEQEERIGKQEEINVEQVVKIATQIETISHIAVPTPAPTTTVTTTKTTTIGTPLEDRA